MNSITDLGRQLQEARHHAQLTQRDLADRVGTSQSAIAKLEQGFGNPTIDTLARCAAAAGFAVHLTLVPLPVADPVIERYKRDVDRTLLRENLRKTAAERLQSLGEWQRDVHALRYAVTRTRPQKVAEPSPKPASRNRRRS